MSKAWQVGVSHSRTICVEPWRVEDWISVLSGEVGGAVSDCQTGQCVRSVSGLLRSLLLVLVWCETSSVCVRACSLGMVGASVWFGLVWVCLVWNSLYVVDE